MTKANQKKVAAVIPAAGQSTRFSGQTRKQFRLLAGKPLLVHTLERICSASQVSLVVVAVPEDALEDSRNLLSPVVPGNIELRMVAGGKTRQDSVAAGLAALSEGADVVVVHDAARPLFEPRWITETIALCRDFDGAIVAIPATDTLKEVDTSSPPRGGSGTIQGTIPRQSVWRAQTPQAFRVENLRQAFDNAIRHGLAGTDEAALVEAIGGRIAVVEGSPDNIKVTTPQDWAWLEWRLTHG